MSRNHQRDYFYKYMSASTALSVLENSSLRWREPSQFNDPFDHQVKYIFPHTQDELATALAKEIEELVYDREPIFKEKTSVSLMVTMLREGIERIPKEELLQALDEGARESAKGLQEYQDNINALIHNVMNNSRVLCVTEHNDNVVMWSHYADEHRGVCIRLQCIDELDNTLLLAKPIQYVDDFPVFPETQEHVKHLTGEEPLSISKLIYDIPYYKHKHWRYEDEWRVHIPHEEPSNINGYNDWSENIRIFGALYLGCRIEPNDTTALLKVVESKYPHMQVFQAKPSTKGFILEFERVR